MRITGPARGDRHRSRRVRREISDAIGVPLTTDLTLPYSGTSTSSAAPVRHHPQQPQHPRRERQPARREDHLAGPGTPMPPPGTERP
ncbi:hypothetical protein QD712_35585 [Streptomyces acidiscabies]|uniref:hypothetical protein n=1 Tax=Streptomyces acidiscabies TaxID=42234 RepID=UPI0030D0A33C